MPNRSFRILVALILLAWSLSTRAASLPGGLAPTEIERVVEILGTGGASRLLRSAEAYAPYPGFKIGLEAPIIPSDDINSLGNQNGSLSGLNPAPRLFAAKGLFLGLELILNYFPASVFNTVSTLGGILKYTAFDEKDNWFATAFYVGVTQISAYGNSYSGNDEEVGAVISKDYVRLKPFVGLGLLFAQGAVSPALASTPQTTAAYNTLHAFLGAEIEMPVQFSFQIDLFNLAPGGSLFVGKHFF